MFPDHQAYLGIHFGRIPPFVFFFFFVVVLRICGPADFPCRHAKKGSDEEGELCIDDGELHMETSQEADTAGLECKSG